MEMLNVAYWATLLSKLVFVSHLDVEWPCTGQISVSCRNFTQGACREAFLETVNDFMSFKGPIYSYDKSTSSCIATHTLLPDPYESQR